jgi:hypothetical protein
MNVLEDEKFITGILFISAIGTAFNDVVMDAFMVA